MRESAVLHRCMLALSEAGCRVFRNNVALAWVGKSIRTSKPVQVTLMPGDVLIRKARPLHAGLCVGSGDLIGWTPDGRFLSVECKTETGRVSSEQSAFADAVSACGGVGIVVRSESEVLQKLQHAVSMRAGA